MTAIIKQIDQFSEASVDDEIVIMRLDNGEFFSLSGTAAALWRLIDGHRDRSALVAAAASEFAADESEITTDVDDFLARLREIGLVSDA